MVGDEGATQALLPLSALIDRVTRVVYAESATFGFCVFRDSEDESLWITSPTNGAFHVEDDAAVYHNVGLIALAAPDWCLKSGCL